VRRRPSRRLALLRALAMAAALVACVLAWRTSGRVGARGDTSRAVPRPPAEPRSVAPDAAIEAYDVAVRLVERANEARFDGPGGAGVERLRGATLVRATKPVHLDAKGEAAGFVANVALPVDASSAKGTAMSPSFDQRESFVAEAPSSLSFKVTIPSGARLSFAEGILAAATTDAVVFLVRVVDEQGRSRQVYRHALRPSQTATWNEASCDLSAYAGQTVELRLIAEVEAEATTKPAAKPRPRPRPAASGTSGPRERRGPDGKPQKPRASAKAKAAPPSPGPPVALWATPTVSGRAKPRLPFNVLWIAVDGLRADAAPGRAGLTPAIDALAARGVRFTNAYASATDARRGIVAMLTGARASELGIRSEASATAGELAAFYASEPPLVPLASRGSGAAVHAFVHDALLTPYAPEGIDFGFERIRAHRPGARDPRAIGAEVATFLRESAGTRFFAFVSLSAAEGHDQAIGEMARALDEAHLRERTVVVLASPHGRTRVPMVLSLPGLPENAEVRTRVRTIDLAPTLLELLGLEKPARVSGRSLLALARGAQEPDRVVVTEGPGTRAILHDRYRLVVRETERAPREGKPRARRATDELFDLTDDPEERNNLATARPDLLAEMRARLSAALANAPVAGAPDTPLASRKGPPVLRLRFVGGAEPRRVSGTLTVGHRAQQARALDVRPVELGRDAVKVSGTSVELAFTTSPSSAVGIDLVLDPPLVPVAWDLYLDDEPWPASAVFAGPFGLVAPSLRAGVATADARAAAESPVLPLVEPRREIGLFVVRERRGEPSDRPTASRKDFEEMARLLREWGYAPAADAKN
jgi:hypothetical protein